MIKLELPSLQLKNKGLLQEGALVFWLIRIYKLNGAAVNYVR